MGSRFSIHLRDNCRPIITNGCHQQIFVVANVRLLLESLGIFIGDFVRRVDHILPVFILILELLLRKICGHCRWLLIDQVGGLIFVYVYCQTVYGACFEKRVENLHAFYFYREKTCSREPNDPDVRSGDIDLSFSKD